MTFKRAALGWLLPVLLIGCAGRAAPPEVGVWLDAAATVEFPPLAQTATLPLTAHLHNDRAQPLELLAATPCAVFRWRVVDSHNQEVQAEANGLCAQAIAMATLPPARRLAKSYEIPLDAERYTAGERYRVVYQFWGYSGRHDFVVAPLAKQPRHCPRQQ